MLELRSNSGATIFVETEGSVVHRGKIASTGRAVGKDLAESLDDVMDTTRKVIQAISNRLNEIATDCNEAKVEFRLTLRPNNLP